MPKDDEHMPKEHPALEARPSSIEAAEEHKLTELPPSLAKAGGGEKSSAVGRSTQAYDEKAEVRSHGRAEIVEHPYPYPPLESQESLDARDEHMPKEHPALEARPSSIEAAKEHEGAPEQELRKGIISRVAPKKVYKETAKIIENPYPHPPLESQENLDAEFEHYGKVKRKRLNKARKRVSRARADKRAAAKARIDTSSGRPRASL